MEVRTVSELSERIKRLEARVAENQRVIESQQEAIGIQQAMLRELTDAYDLFESAMVEMANYDSTSRSARPKLHLLR